MEDFETRSGPLRTVSVRFLGGNFRIPIPYPLRGLLDWLGGSPVGHRLIRGTFWSTAGTLVSRCLGLAAAILAARIVGKVVYGELGIIQSTVGMLGTLAGFGMGTTTSKFVAELRAKDPIRVGRIIGLSSLVSWVISLLLAVALIVLAPWLCSQTLAAPYLSVYVRDSAPLLVFSGINGAQLGVLSGFESFRAIARVSCFTGLLNFPLIVAGAVCFGLPGIIWGMVIAQAGGCLLNYLALGREARTYGIPISYRSCLAELPVLWTFSIPAVLAEILISAVNWSTATMLVRRPNGYGAMGAFNAANQWFSAVMWLPFMLNSVALPVLAERLGADDKAETAKLLKITVKVNALVVLPIVAIGCICSPVIMSAYGKGFRSEWPTLVAVLVTSALLTFELPVGQLVAASNHMWLGFASNIGWGLVFLGTTPLLLNRGWGGFGLASSRLLAYAAHTVFSIIYTIVFIVAAKKSLIVAKSRYVAIGAETADSDAVV